MLHIGERFTRAALLVEVVICAADLVTVARLMCLAALLLHILLALTVEDVLGGRTFFDLASAINL